MSYLLHNHDLISGYTPVRVYCFLDSINSSHAFDFQKPNKTYPFAADENYNTFGLAGSTISTFFDTKESVNYLFVELVKDTYNYYASILGPFDGSMKILAGWFSQEGYGLEAAVVDDSPVDLNNNGEPLENIQSTQATWNNDPHLVLGSHCMFLSSKTKLTYKYGTIPMYTKKFILWGRIMTCKNSKTPSENGVSFLSSYITLQYSVKGRELGKSIFGRNLTTINIAPLSAQIITDRSGDGIVLATFQSPSTPMLVINTKLVDIYTSVTSICRYFLISAIIIRQLGNLKKYRRLSFDVDLEVLHKALENLDGLVAWNFPVKLKELNILPCLKGLHLCLILFQQG